MFSKIKECLTKAVSWFDDLLFYEEPEDNTYCIPCTWTFSGRVYVSAPDVESQRCMFRLIKSLRSLKSAYATTQLRIRITRFYVFAEIAIRNMLFRHCIIRCIAHIAGMAVICNELHYCICQRISKDK